MSKLKPCPFCGEKEELYPFYKDFGRSGPFWIECLGCGIELHPHPNGPDVVTAWNRRDGVKFHDDKEVAA
ncbi:MAG: Lar family restriction alleviation protein [Hyphomicrobium sp.]|jgi:Lar family restriction alleviation protein